METSAKRLDTASAGFTTARQDLTAKTAHSGAFGQSPYSKDFNAHLDRLTEGHLKATDSAPAAVYKTSTKLRLRVRVRVSEVYTRAGRLSWDANIVSADGTVVGRMERTFLKNADGTVSVKHEKIVIDNKDLRGTGFGKAFSDDAESWYRSSGVDRITLRAGKETGGYTWAKAGYGWADEKSAASIINRFKAKVRENNSPLTPSELTEARAVIDRASRSTFGSPDYPSPSHIAAIGSNGSSDFFGKRVLTGSSWNGVKLL
ncbi:hypothetical protein [Streptomyces sp. SID3343]|uniref:hypothetical protein n=1 Tax=Streptomyces sp. SID3343 TaxID=2690260 RepID=UPI001367A766|nr:hypothetical protein [Streptomyces sp. SID3343]MYV98857.1 hypothetical protein [Streptomyces sp. SID3343]